MRPMSTSQHPYHRMRCHSLDDNLSWQALHTHLFAAKMCCQAFNVCGLDKETGGMQRAHVALCVCVSARASLRQAALNASVEKDPPLCLIIGSKAQTAPHFSLIIGHWYNNVFYQMFNPI